MLAKTFSATHLGIDGSVIQIEAIRHNANPGIHITGLPGDVVKESRERIRACLTGFGFDVPSARILVHLSPATAKKQGSQLDLGIALSVLVAEGAISGSLIQHSAFLGELSIDGSVHAIPGIVPLLQALEECRSVKTVFIPKKNSWEAALLQSKKAAFVSNLSELLSVLNGQQAPDTVAEADYPSRREGNPFQTIDSVIGHELAKRALVIALAGRHHLLLIGSPGVGKTYLASRSASLLPDLGPESWIEVVKNFSHTPLQMPSPMRPPYRSPHHTISTSGLLGGGSGQVIPGEVTLAHHGVLFLDELPEFRRDAIEGLREPMQNGIIHLHRIGQALSLPARFSLIAAMNPCPCGFFFSRSRCRCQPDKVIQYQRRISGAVLDRTDLLVRMTTPLPGSEKAVLMHAQASQAIHKAVEIQKRRYGGDKRNADAAVNIDEGFFALEKEERRWFDGLMQEGKHSLRSLHKIVRVARTIADLCEAQKISLDHLYEAKVLQCEFGKWHHG